MSPVAAGNQVPVRRRCHQWPAMHPALAREGNGRLHGLLQAFAVDKADEVIINSLTTA